jgi:hypothetical protein
MSTRLLDVLDRGRCRGDLLGCLEEQLPVHRLLAQHVLLGDLVALLMHPDRLMDGHTVAVDPAAGSQAGSWRLGGVPAGG